MPEFPAQLLAQWTGGRWTAQPVSPLSGFCIDSRQLQRGEVFVAIRTDRRDGHEFVAAAAERGAGAALVAKADPASALPQLVVEDPLAAFQAIAREHRRQFRGPVVGISGSAGKTSTKDLLALLLGGACGVPATGDSVSGAAPARHGALTGRVLATEGNLNNHLGVPLTLTRLDPARHDFAVIEAGISAPGEMGPLAAMIDPDLSVITLIGPAHTEALGGLEGVAQEKSRLCAATRRAGVALFSADTAGYPAFRELTVCTLVVERVDTLRREDCRPGSVAYTLEHCADASTVGLPLEQGGETAFTFRRVSDGMAQNAVLAICAALRLNVSPELIQARLAQWRPAKLRGEIRRDGDRLLYLDCYNANPASMADALSVFDALTPAPVSRLFIVGSMEELGAESAAYHRALGRSFELRSGDQLFVVGTHAAEVRDGAVETRDVASQVHVASSALELAPVVREWRGAVFVKGSRRYQLEKAVDPAEAPHGQH